MNFNKKDIIYLLIISLIFFYFRTNKEKMTTSIEISNYRNYIKSLIKNKYNTNIDSLRNLSNISKNISNNGKLKIIGGLEVEGGLMINDSMTINKDLSVNNNIMVDGKITSNNNLEIDNDITVDGEGIIGSAYIGKKVDTQNINIAQFSHKDKKREYISFLSKKNGVTEIKSYNSKDLVVLINDSKGLKFNNDKTVFDKITNVNRDIIVDRNVTAKSGILGSVYIGNWDSSGDYVAIGHQRNINNNNKSKEYLLAQHKDGSTIINTHSGGKIVYRIRDLEDSTRIIRN